MESTTLNKGNPFSVSNKLCTVALKEGDAPTVVYKIEYDNEPYGPTLKEIQKKIDNCDLLVGFNLKFDLHWIRRYGISFEEKEVWDVQYSFFCQKFQTIPMPSLNQVARHYGHEEKLDVVATEYWDKGIDTPDIPYDILSEYNAKDVDITYDCFLKQIGEVERGSRMYTLIRMGCLDLLVLEEMEWNGLPLDLEGCDKAAVETAEELEQIDESLSNICGIRNINWNSLYSISAVLYGGVITWTEPEIVEVILKSGEKKMKVKKIEKSKTFPRLVEPLPKTELNKVGYWSISSGVLSELKAKGKAREIIDLIKMRQKKSKLLNTYYIGLPELIKEMQWADNTIHGNLNQCQAITGRLSSSKPNLQNMTEEIDKLFVSRYANQC